MAANTTGPCLEFGVAADGAVPACGNPAGHEGPHSWERDVTPKRCETTKTFSVGALGERAVRCSEEAGHPWPCERWTDVHPLQHCPLTGDLTLGDWECKREAGHDGPCAAVPVFPDRSHVMQIEDVELCSAERRWLAADSLTVYADACCVLGPGHDGPHAGAVSWT